MEKKSKFLSDLDKHRKAKIMSLNKEIFGPEYTNSLLDFGFLPGSEITVLQKFPENDKIIVQLQNQKLAIRLSDAKNIEILV